MEGFIKQKKGITLIALVITIVVLLILAGVTISTLMGDNGILTKANDAEVEQSHATVREALELAYNEWKIQINTSSNAKLASTETIVIQGKEENAESETTTTFFDFLVSKSYVDELTRIIDVEKLTGSKQTLGNGTGSTDVYKLNEDDNTYKLVYYGENEEDITDIINIAKTEEENPFIYTQADIDNSLKYFTWELKTVEQKDIEERGYSQDKLGQTVAVIKEINHDYYTRLDNNGGIGYYILPIDKLVIPNTIEGADFVEISLTSSDAQIIRGVETIIYLNEYGTFDSEDVAYMQLPDKEEYISNSKELEDVKVSESNLYYTVENGVVLSKDRTSVCLYPRGKEESFYKLPEEVMTIKNGAFQLCANLRRVELSDNLTTIGNSAFEYCTSLETIIIPAKVTSIGEFAFGSCPDLTITVESGSPLTIDDFRKARIDPNKVIFK